MTGISVFISLAIVAAVSLLGKDFQNGFMQGLLSNLLALFIFGIFVGQFTELFKKPDLSIVVQQDGFYSNELVMKRSEDGYYEAEFSLGIKNNGSGMLKAGEGYWHFYLPGNTQWEINQIGYSANDFQRNHFRDLIGAPVFSKYFLDTGAKFKVKIGSEHRDQIKFRYFFNTSYGLFPSTVSMNKETSETAYESMGSLKVKFID